MSLDFAIVRILLDYVDPIEYVVLIVVLFQNSLMICYTPHALSVHLIWALFAHSGGLRRAYEA